MAILLHFALDDARQRTTLLIAARQLDAEVAVEGTYVTVQLPSPEAAYRLGLLHGAALIPPREG